MLAAIGYMALTLLVESGWLGAAWAGARSGAAACWARLRGTQRQRRRQGGATYERMIDDEECAGAALPDLAIASDDEDVREERVALQAGTQR
jgi:hypothetical protein